MGVLRLFSWTIAVCLLVQLLKASELPMLNSNCPDLEDPFSPTQLAHPSDCNKFYKCSGGYAYPMTCPPNLHWNDISKRCDYPSEAGCDPYVRTDTSSKIAGIPHADCPAVDEWNNPRQLPYPGSCTKFYKCQAGLAYPMDCPAGLHWSTSLNRCEWPGVAGCQGTGGNPSPAPAPAPAPAPVPTPAPTPSPTRRPGGIWHPNCPAVDDLSNPVGLPYPGDCSKFYMCEAGFAYPVECPSGYHWSVSYRRCLWPSVAQCTATPAPTTATPAPTPATPAPTPATPAPTPATPAPTPATPAPTPATPAPTPATPAPSPATPAPTPAIDETKLDAYCQSQTPVWTTVYLPYPSQASRYIVCSRGRGWIEKCHSGFTFNPITQLCGN